MSDEEQAVVTEEHDDKQSCEVVMSKKQQKRLLKSQRIKETRPQWRAEQRAKEKEKKRKRKLEGQTPAITKRPRRMSDEGASSVRVAIDLSYDELMTEKDIKMLLKQCKRCYSENRKAEKPVQFYLTSLGGKFREKMDVQVPGYKNWDVNITQDNYIDHFGKENVVFLAAESPNVLSELDTSKAYIIGGLVDHNHHKGYCYGKAVELGIQHAQLPIADFVVISGRKVLAVNHVFEILLWYVQTGSWKEAFERVIPLRKFDKNELTDESTASEQTVERQTSKQGIKEQPVSSKQGIGEQQMSKQDDQKANKQEISVQGTSE